MIFSLNASIAAEPYIECSQKIKKAPAIGAALSGDLTGNRTPIAGMKTRCPNR
jgi:hypothetical protein